MKRAYYMALVAVVCAVGCGSVARTSAHHGEVDVVWSEGAPVAALGAFVDNRHRLAFANRDASEFRWLGDVRWTMNRLSGGEMVIAYVNKTVWGNPARAHFYGWRNPSEPGGSPRPVFEYEVEGIGAEDFKATFVGKSFVVRVRDPSGGWGEVVRVSLP